MKVRRETKYKRWEKRDGRWETDDGRRKTGDRSLKTGDGRQVTGDRWRETGDSWLESVEWKREIFRLFARSLILKSDMSDSLMSLLTKNDNELFAHFALYKRAMWENCYHRSLKRAVWVIHSWIEWIARKKWANCSKNSYFSNVFNSFATLYAQEQIALSLTKFEQIARKTDEQIPNPDRTQSSTLILQ